MLHGQDLSTNVKSFKNIVLRENLYYNNSIKAFRRRNMADKNDITKKLGTAPVPRLLISLAIPSVIAQIVNLLYNIVDRIYIGHMDSSDSTALTGVGLCFPIICLIGAFTMLIAQGGAPRAAIFMGKGDNRSAQKILGNCFSAVILMSVVLTAVFLIFSEKLLWMFGASEDTIGYALDYARIYTVGSIFVMISMGLNLFISTQGFTLFSMGTVLIGAGLNIILDPIFIFVLGMGVKGAAIATVISQGVSAVWTILFLTGKKTKLKLSLPDMKPDVRLLLPCLGLGLAPFVMQSTEAVINVAFNSSLQNYGGDIAVGTMTVAATIMQVIWMPAQGIGMGAQPIISFNYGAGNPDRCIKAIKTMLLLTGVYFLSLWLTVQLFPKALMEIFTDDALLLGNYNLIRVYVGATGFFFFQTTAQQGLVSVGKAKASLFIACLRKLILLVPLIYILPRFFENKVFAVFLAEPVSDTISIITASVIFIFVFGGEMKKLKKEKGIS